jgi:hypothetical protein
MQRMRLVSDRDAALGNWTRWPHYSRRAPRATASHLAAGRRAPPGEPRHAPQRAAALSAHSIACPDVSHVRAGPGPSPHPRPPTPSSVRLLGPEGVGRGRRGALHACSTPPKGMSSLQHPYRRRQPPGQAPTAPAANVDDRPAAAGALRPQELRCQGSPTFSKYTQPTPTTGRPSI